MYTPFNTTFIQKTGVYRGIPIFLIFAPKHRLCVPTIYGLSKNKKNINIRIFHRKFSIFKNLDPVVQSIVSLTMSLRHKFVKQISAKVTNTLLFFVEKM